MSKHTPGPWRLNRRFCFNVEDENGRTVARVNSEPETYDEALANARLIAAAPDLLAAAEKALEYMSTRKGGWHHPLYAQLEAAIAKARGNEVKG